MKYRLPLLVVALVALGCKSNQAVEAKPGAVPNPVATTQTSTPSEPAKGANPTPGSPATTEATKSAEAAKPAPPIPANLNHDAFRYYGLGNTKGQNLEIIVSGQSSMSGTQSYVYKGEKNGVRSYEVRHTGTLSQLGDWEVEVRPDGLYMTGMTSGKMESPEMELPAKLEVGNSWKSSSNFQDKSGKSVQLTSTARVFASEKVTVPAGTFDAIRIEQDGEGTLSGQKAKVRTKAWYVKDRGNVKTEVTTTPENGAVSTYIIQETN